MKIADYADLIKLLINMISQHNQSCSDLDELCMLEDEAIDIQNMHIQQVASDILKENGALSEDFYSYSADKLIIVITRVENLFFITYNTEIPDYKKHGFIKLI